MPYSLAFLTAHKFLSKGYYGLNGEWPEFTPFEFRWDMFITPKTPGNYHV